MVHLDWPLTLTRPGACHSLIQWYFVHITPAMHPHLQTRLPIFPIYIPALKAEREAPRITWTKYPLISHRFLESNDLTSILTNPQSWIFRIYLRSNGCVKEVKIKVHQKVLIKGYKPYRSWVTQPTRLLDVTINSTRWGKNEYGRVIP